MRSISIKNMTIGKGMPKTIVSLMGEDLDELLGQARRAIAAGADCLEYRADFARDTRDHRTLADTARALEQEFQNNPVLFTCRTTGQGGKAQLSADELACLCAHVIANGAADMVDIESWLGDSAIRSLCDEARKAGVASVVSFHDFTGTPTQHEMERMLVHFSELGADIPKIAVMANNASDALALLAATERVSRTGDTGPLLTMAMGAQGSLTRLAGETFGSALTFCALDKPSAPGQVAIAQAKNIMEQLHEIAAR